MKKLDSIGKLFSDTWKLLNERGGTVMKILALPVVLVFLPRFFTGGHHIVVTPFAIAAALLALIGAIIFGIAIPAAILVYHDDAKSGDAWRRGMKLFWPLVWVVIVEICATFGGFVMLIVPGIIMVVWFSLAQFTFVIEGRRGLTALTQSRAYIRGYWWAMVGRAILLALIEAAVSFVLYIPLWIIFGSTLGYGLANLITSLALVPFSIAYSYTLYRNFAALKPELASGHTSESKTFLTVSGAIGAVIIAVLVGFFILGGIFSFSGGSNPVPLGPNIPAPSY